MCCNETHDVSKLPEAIRTVVHWTVAPEGGSTAVQVDVHNWTKNRIYAEGDPKVAAYIAKVQQHLSDNFPGDVWDAETHEMILRNGEPVPMGQGCSLTVAPNINVDQR